MRSAPRSLLTSLCALALAPAVLGQVTTKLVRGSFARPLWAGAPAGDPRIFVAVKSGRIQQVLNDTLISPAFLDINSQISTGDEQGLLGVAFHPNYAQNGFFYVNYTDVNGDTVVSRFSVSADPYVADPDSELVLLTQGQPFDNHNGGDIHFGPDGYLYVAFGDGGSANDPACNAQDLGTWLGKMLRIDVDSGSPYAVPADNPFVGVPGALPEIWHFGLRNPWRFSFDAATGDMFIGDVGQNAREEISFAGASESGLNFGWKTMEGTRCNSTAACATVPPPCGDAAYRDPIHELFQSMTFARAIIGGYVYRGCMNPGEVGTYFFSDNNDSLIRSFQYDPVTGIVSNVQDRTAEFDPPGTLQIRNVGSFGEDGFGELLIVDNSGGGGAGGEVYKMVPATASEAAAVARNGGGTNNPCYASNSLPIIGNEWEFEVDVSAHPGATSVHVIAYTLPTSGTFLGAGELLIDVSSSFVFMLAHPSSGGIDAFSQAIPCDASLDGVTAASQVLVLGGGAELCNAVDVTVGYY